MVTDKDFEDYKLTGDLLDAFGCDSSKKGYYDFVEIVYRMRLKLRENPQNTAIIAEIVDEMYKSRKMPRRGFYGNIRRVIAPLLESDSEFWETLGGKLPKKMTVGHVALYLAQVFENQSS